MDSGAPFREFQRQMERFIQRMKRRQRKEWEARKNPPEEYGPWQQHGILKSVWPVPEDPEKEDRGGWRKQGWSV